MNYFFNQKKITSLPPLGMFALKPVGAATPAFPRQHLLVSRLILYLLMSPVPFGFGGDPCKQHTFILTCQNMPFQGGI